MSRIVKVFDPNITKRPVTVFYTEDACPGLLEFFSTLPYRSESSLIRTIVHDWFVSHKEAGTLDAAVAEILGQAACPPKRIAKRTPPKAVQPATRSRRHPSAVADASGHQSNERQQGRSMVVIEQPEPNLQTTSEHNVTIESSVADAAEADHRSMEPKVDPGPSSRSMDAGHSQNRSEILESLSFLDNLP